ncbi:MAG: hypothetical protein RJS97_22310 [Parvibaculaceae bacterium]
MRLSTVGFYYDFTRLFAALHGSQTRSGRKICVTNYAAYTSAFFFESPKHMRRVFLPVAARLNRSEVSTPSPTNTEWIGEYLEASGVSRHHAVDIAMKYLRYFMTEFERTKPDAVVVSGDTRLQARAASEACRLLGIRHVYFEQGPFRTTTLDAQGVNCTASFAKNFSNTRDFEGSSRTFLEVTSKTRERFQENRVARILDYALEPIFLALGWSEVREEKSFWWQASKVLKKPFRTLLPSQPPPLCQPSTQEAILVIGQVPSDANFLLHSRYPSHLELMQEVEQLSGQYPITFREHPLFAGSYGKAFYDFIDSHKRISLSHESNLETEIQNVDLVVVVNSTVGMEVVLQHKKPVLCLGDASYSHLNGVYSRDQIRTFLNAKAEVTATQHDQNCAWFLSSFLEGHFRDKDLSGLVSNIGENLDAL